VVSWCSNDLNDVSGTRTYITTSGTPVEEYFFDNDFSSNTFAYQPATLAGSQTVGETAPTGQSWQAAAIEIQAAPQASGNFFALM
jgi:hypothetical protein